MKAGGQRAPFLAAAIIGLLALLLVLGQKAGIGQAAVKSELEIGAKEDLFVRRGPSGRLKGFLKLCVEKKGGASPDNLYDCYFDARDWCDEMKEKNLVPSATDCIQDTFSLSVALAHKDCVNKTRQGIENCEKQRNSVPLDDYLQCLNKLHQPCDKCFKDYYNKFHKFNADIIVTTSCRYLIEDDRTCTAGAKAKISDGLNKEICWRQFDGDIARCFKKFQLEEINKHRNNQELLTAILKSQIFDFNSCAARSLERCLLCEVGFLSSMCRDEIAPAAIEKFARNKLPNWLVNEIEKIKPGTLMRLKIYQL